MTEFVIAGTIGFLLIIITSFIMYEMLRNLWRVLPGMKLHPHGRVLVVTSMVFLTHIICIWLYAIVFYLLDNYTEVGYFSGVLPGSPVHDTSFVDGIYFSAVTYTSLGFGDMVPYAGFRMLSGIEVLDGLVLIGWSVSFLYLTMEKFWQLPHQRK